MAMFSTVTADRNNGIINVVGQYALNNVIYNVDATANFIRTPTTDGGSVLEVTNISDGAVTLYKDVMSSDGLLYLRDGTERMKMLA